MEVQVDWMITDYLRDHLEYAALRMGWWRYEKSWHIPVEK